MLDFLKKLLDAPQGAPAPREPKEAVAALMVEAARAACAAGEAAQAQAADLVQFTRVVKTGLSAEERVALLEALWSVVFADGERDPHEDALMRKLAPLIAMTDRESAEARRRVLAAQGGG
jgi:uncharacterized tellurite resistance protein B-like protein